MTQAAFRVLFVCTGNICRSPSAERLLEARLASVSTDALAARIAVASAGTAALAGHGIDEPTAHALRRRGADADHHVARRLTSDQLAAAGLVLTAESAHRSVVVQTDPLSFRKAFTIREFARLGATLPPLPEPVTADALHQRVVEVSGQRGRVDAPEPGADEIGDPFGAGIDVADATVAQVSAAVDGVLAALGLVLPTPAGGPRA